jgi:hypothetical protein
MPAPASATGSRMTVKSALQASLLTLRYPSTRRCRFPALNARSVIHDPLNEHGTVRHHTPDGGGSAYRNAFRPKRSTLRSTVAHHGVR